MGRRSPGSSEHKDRLTFRMDRRIARPAAMHLMFGKIKVRVLGLTINSPFNPDNGIPMTVSKAAYLVIADQGTWTPEDSTSGKQVGVQEQHCYEGCSPSDAA